MCQDRGEKGGTHDINPMLLSSKDWQRIQLLLNEGSSMPVRREYDLRYTHDNQGILKLL